VNDTGAITEQFWDKFYANYSGSEHSTVNRYLVSETEHLTPGTALDLGCAGGNDAIWLAEHGWRVKAVDVSATALDRGRARATNLGLDDRIIFEKHELADDFPEGLFDLVSAQFLHSPIGGPEERAHILHRATMAVAPGGHLLVVSHKSMPPWQRGMPPGLTDQPLNFTLPSPEENVAALQLVDGDWDVIRAETVALDMTGPEAQSGKREDHVLHFRRRASAS
jgi:SAM-dependent methyltransferase